MEERGPSVDSVYLPIRDAWKCIHERVNIFAAVSSIGAEKKSRGTDYVVSLKVMDQSYMEPGISVNFFAEDMTKLPHVRSIGDIISLQNVEVRIHRGDVYCVHNKKFSAFALFQGKTTSGLIHYQKSAKYHATNHDDEFLSQIRTWLLDNPPKAVGKDVPLLLRRIKLDLAFDLVCKGIGCSLCGMELILLQQNYSLMLDYDYKPYTTLIESLSHPEVTHKCMCIVRVVAAYPWQAKDLRSPVTGHYRVRFTVEDPTARIHAYICGEDGVKFFEGYPTTEVLTSKMDKLLGITDTDGQAGSDDGVRNPPWVWCCLKSYYLDENNPRGSRRYRIFSTTLVG